MSRGIPVESYDGQGRGSGSGIRMRPGNSLSGGLIMPRSSGTIQRTPDPEFLGWLDRVVPPEGQNPYYPAPPPPATHPPFRNMSLPTAPANHTHAPGRVLSNAQRQAIEERIRILRANIARCQNALQTQDPSEIFDFGPSNTWVNGKPPW